MSQWFALKNNQPVGPLDLDAMQQRIRAGEFNASTMVCRVGGTEWSPLGEDDLLRSASAGTRSAPPPLSAPGAAAAWDVAATARNHRFVMYCLLGMIGSIAVMTMLGLAGGAPLIPLLWLPYGASAIAALVFMCLTLIAMRMHVGLIILFAVLMLVPCVGIITLLVVSQIVQAKLRSAGLKVGLLGVSARDVEAAGFR